MLRLKKQEKREVVAAVTNAAVAMAELWDVLSDIESAHNCEFDDTAQMVSNLAGSCNMPPSPSDLTDDDILEELENCRI